MFNPDDYKLDVDCMAFPNDQTKWFFRCVIGGMPIDSKRTYTKGSGAYKAGENWLRKNIYKPHVKAVTGLTKRQSEVLDFIISFHSKNSYPPTRKEIAEKFRFNTNAAFEHVKGLEKRGVIKVIPNTSRGIVFL